VKVCCNGGLPCKVINYFQENFKKDAEEATKMFERDINDVIVATKKYMVKASTEMWRCDPDHHVRGIVYVCRALDNSIYQCSFKVPIKGGVEESIVNAQLVCKNTNNAKKEVRFKQLIRDP
jgi:hypothetical protein